MTAGLAERQLEGFFLKRVRLVGGHTIKLAPTEAGIPDRLVVLPGGRIYLVELKTRTGQLSPVQRHWHEKVARLGVTVQVLYGEDQIISWIRQAVNAIGPQYRNDDDAPRP